MNEKPTSGERTIRAVVARGHSIMAATGEKRVATYDVEGKAVVAPVMKQYLEGQEVDLLASDVAWLRGTGHLIDPNYVPPKPAQGARVSETGNVGLVSA